MLPWLVGVGPFGVVVGITARTSGVPVGIGLLTGVVIFSGSAQLTALELLGGGAGIGIVVTSVLVINARLVLYSASIAPSWRGTGRLFRAAAAAVLVDPSYAVGVHTYEGADADRDRRSRHIEYLSAGITLFAAWQVAMLIGIVIGARVPTWLGLEFVIPLFLLAEVVHAARSRPSIVAAVGGGIVALGGGSLPLHSGLLAAVLVGVAGAVASERWVR
jgi:predicted branched-subunit amino acid permease